ncbi:MAG: ArsC/Spx/MgsR family protein [Paracoccaceae bacterium]|jgi:arsenate reductase
MTTLYGLKNCDTCRKALKIIDDVEFVDVRSDGVPHNVLVAALQEFAEALVNRRSTTWRNLSDQEQAQEPVSLLQQYPSLMKRPLIQKDGKLFLGWDAKTQAALGAGS